MAWIASATSRLKRVVSAPATWAAVWVIGAVAGWVANNDWLALVPFLIAAPALLLTLIADMRLYEAPPPLPAEPMDLASRVRRKKQQRLLERFARVHDATGHTLH